MLIYHLLHTDINIIHMSLNTDSWFNTDILFTLDSDLQHTDINMILMIPNTNTWFNTEIWFTLAFWSTTHWHQHHSEHWYMI